MAPKNDALAPAQNLNRRSFLVAISGSALAALLFLQLTGCGGGGGGGGSSSPPAAGATQTATIPTSGGTVGQLGSSLGAQLTFSSGATQSPTQITITQDTTPATSNLTLASPTFELTSSGATTFTAPVTLTLNFDTSFGSGVSIASIANGSASPVSSSITSPGVITATITHFSTWAVVVDTVSITGKLINSVNSSALTYRTVTVQGTSLSAVTDTSGNFTINNVPTGPQVLIVTDDTGASDGTLSVTVSGASAVDSLGSLSLSVNGVPPPPPPPN